MGVGKQVARVIHRSAGHLAANRLEHLGVGVRCSPFGDGADDHVAVMKPRTKRAGLVCGGPLRPTDGNRQLSPVVVGRRADGNRPIGRIKDVERHDVLVLVAAGRGVGLAHHAVAGDPDFAQGHHSVDHRHVHELALARSLRVKQRRQHAHGADRARIGVADIGADDVTVGRAAPSGRDHAGHGLGDHVVGGPVHVGALARTRVAEAADGAIDEPRVALMEHLPAHSERVHDPCAHVLDECVRRFDELQELLPLVVVGEVERDAPLVAVVVGEPGAEVALGVLPGERRHLAGQLAPRRLNLDDISAQVGQHHRRPRSRQRMGAVDDANALQRPRVLGGHRGYTLVCGQVRLIGRIQHCHVVVSLIRRRDQAKFGRRFSTMAA